MAEIDQKQLAGTVGRAISKQRVRSGLTQEAVAERLGVGNEAVSRIERGVVMPNITRLLEFADIFGCEAAELLSEVSPLVDDQASRINHLLVSLDQSDRELVVELVERLVNRLKT
ncbi:helix-turn-helix domain-containing protein [Pseudomonas mucidolens]|uniref:Transcriptional regulator, contains XRE-family HTH domain n=2 Tax=Pseudomonas fluorescens group TaxID=136843 RepID=A0A1H2P2P9_9PSED|nr:helix-turn-helix transcriptional regulator [Pseudomonas mucidolens]SDV11952.1 Transcriptional regulator, contains XRE-family HTH domain [Pseudomonas mucidolens]SQH36429.1 XRE family transcriptional regulator [Pseudomonas mucidolens]